MAIPGIGAAVTSGIGALFNLGAAIKQGRQAKEAGRKAKEMEEKGWNKYHTPEAFNRSLAMSENQYLSPNMLGQSLLEDKLGASTANQVSRINRTAGSGAEALLGLGMAQNNYNNQLNNIAMQSAQQRYADFNGFMNMLGKKGDYQDKEWEINKWTPYQNTLDEKRALETSSRANWQNFGKSIGDAGVTGFMMKNMAGGQGGERSPKNLPVPSPEALGFNKNALMPTISDQAIAPTQTPSRPETYYPNWGYAQFLKGRGITNYLTPRF